MLGYAESHRGLLQVGCSGGSIPLAAHMGGSSHLIRAKRVLKMTWQALACELENLEGQVGAAAQQLAWAPVDHH